MDCEQRSMLLRAYNEAALAMWAAVEHVRASGVREASAVYDLRRHAAARARVQFDLATRAYEKHLEEHACASSVGYEARKEAMVESA